jgi:hypothetical protein
MMKLRAVQINDRAAEGLMEYYNCLRPDQIIYLTPCDGMSVEKALDITKGNRLVLVGDYKYIKSGINPKYKGGYK